MAKGLGILIAPAKASKRSMYDEDEGADEAPDSERGESGEYEGELADHLEVVLGSRPDKEQCEAFKDAVNACFREFEREPHEEAGAESEDE